MYVCIYKISIVRVAKTQAPSRRHLWENYKMKFKADFHTNPLHWLSQSMFVTLKWSVRQNKPDWIDQAIPTDHCNRSVDLSRLQLMIQWTLRDKDYLYTKDTDWSPEYFLPIHLEPPKEDNLLTKDKKGSHKVSSTHRFHCLQSPKLIADPIIAGDQ